MSVNETQTDPEHQVILVSIPKQAGILLAQSAAAGTTVSVWLPDYSSFDFNVVLLWVVAVGTFTLAGICAANDYKGADAAVNDEVHTQPSWLHVGLSARSSEEASLQCISGSYPPAQSWLA